MTQNPQHPLLGIIDGGSMSADDAAWAAIADAAAAAIKFPGLSSESASELADLREAALRCARLPAARSQAGSA